MATKITLVKPDNQTVSEIVAACRALGMVKKEWGNGSVAVQMKSYHEFLKGLGGGDCSKEVKLFRKTFAALGDFVNGDAKMTWVLHRKGSFAIYGTARA